MSDDIKHAVYSALDTMYGDIAVQAMNLNSKQLSADALLYKFNVATLQKIPENSYNLPPQAHQYIQHIKTHTCCVSAADLVCNLQTALDRLN